MKRGRTYWLLRDAFYSIILAGNSVSDYDNFKKHPVMRYAWGRREEGFAHLLSKMPQFYQAKLLLCCTNVCMCVARVFSFSV